MIDSCLTTGEIAAHLGVPLIGDSNIAISRIAAVDSASAGSITFVTGRKFLHALAASTASAVILPERFAVATSIAKLISDDPYLCYARLTQLWVNEVLPQRNGFIHSTAVIDESVQVHESASVGALAVIESGTVIGEGAQVGSGCFVGRSCKIGRRSMLHPNATIMQGSTIGEDCEIHPGAVLGADGFGWAPAKDGWQKIHQLGNVRLGDRISVGACTTIDRGALEDTVIEDGVILDNHIQVAHNVTIGRNTAIAGCTGIAGSTTIGSNCRIGGAVSIVGHIDICDNATVTANSFVNRSIVAPGSYSSGFPLEESSQWRKNAVRLHKLDEFMRRSRHSNNN